MHRKIVASLLATALLSILILTTQPARSEYTIGVKPGDWIEYHVSTTGNPPPEKHIVWARLEVLDVKGDTFHVNSTGQEVNGTYSSFIRTFNFPEGFVSAWIIIPADLGPGETFYDSSENQSYAIQGEQQESVAGATRTITYISSMDRYKQWDKATGVFVETIDNVGGNYTVNATACATNMWSPQILGLDENVFYVVVVAVVVIIALVLIVLFARRRKQAKSATAMTTNSSM